MRPEKENISLAANPSKDQKRKDSSLKSSNQKIISLTLHVSNSSKKMKDISSKKSGQKSLYKNDFGTASFER